MLRSATQRLSAVPKVPLMMAEKRSIGFFPSTSKEKIDVFERYGKKKPEQEGLGGAEAVAPVVEPVAEKVVENVVADEPLPEGRARAPWDDEPVEAADVAPTPRPEVKDWDFGCPDDVRKN